MKRILGLTHPTTGLAKYLEKERDAATWDGFGSHEGSSDSKRELTEALAVIQHGLCGYCEIDLHPRDRQIDHVIPQSDQNRAGSSRSLDVLNMIACCTGGTSYDPGIRRVPTRFRSPIRSHMSCGQAKGDISDQDFLDPRILPALPSLVYVLIDGEIEPDVDACATAGIKSSRVQRTINILRLNVPRLKDARANLWQQLLSAWGEQSDGDTLRKAAEQELLPDETGMIPSFFTTTRSYFRPLSEEILAENLKSWI